jgi:hypothetical protein
MVAFLDSVCCNTYIVAAIDKVADCYGPWTSLYATATSFLRSPICCLHMA